MPTRSDWSLRKEVLEPVLDIFTSTAESQQLELVFENEMAVQDMRVSLDKMRCQQVLINLISNAIKFSIPNTKIRVTIGRPEQVELSYWLFKISVTDEGIGLDDEDRQHLFSPYFRS